MFKHQKIVIKLSKKWVWDPGSVIREKNYSGSQAPDPGSGSATLDKRIKKEGDRAGSLYWKKCSVDTASVKQGETSAYRLDLATLSSSSFFLMA
jgi:hypothetical protein